MKFFELEIVESEDGNIELIQAVGCGDSDVIILSKEQAKIVAEEIIRLSSVAEKQKIL